MNPTVNTVILFLALATILGSGTLWLNHVPSSDSKSTSTRPASQIPVLLPLTATISSPGTNLSIPARPASFGPGIPVRKESPDNKNNDTDGDDVGFTGKLQEVSSLGCKLDEDYEDLSGKIALVTRGGCGFYDKILVLQEWGAIAVIVGDNTRHRGLVTMFSKEDIDLAQVPSVFVSYDSYQTLRLLGTVTIYAGSEGSPIADTMIFLLVSPLCSLSLIYGLLLFHRRYKIMKERAPKSFVDSLPTRIWVKRQLPPEIVSGGGGVIEEGEPYSDTGGMADQDSTRNDTHSDEDNTENREGRNTHLGPEKIWASSGECIICLEEYVPGVSLVMTLPCDHEFHAECISKWLVSRRKTCPICKKSVMENGETTPLIQRQRSPNEV